jgi:hypothetical protein
MKWTVQELVDHGMRIEAYCHRSSCNHHRAVDLQLLRDWLGPDAPTMADHLKPLLVCAKCRGKAVGLIYSRDFGGPQMIESWEQAGARAIDRETPLERVF